MYIVIVNNLISAKGSSKACCKVVCFAEEDMEDEGPDDLGAQFTEIFVKKADNVGLLLSLLEVCIYTLQLILDTN